MYFNNLDSQNITPQPLTQVKEINEDEFDVILSELIEF